jgi:hypothetical protein
MAWAIGVVLGAMLMAVQTANPMMERLVKAVPTRQMERMEAVQVPIAVALPQALVEVEAVEDMMGSQEPPKAAVALAAPATEGEAAVVALREMVQRIRETVAQVEILMWQQAVADRRPVMSLEEMVETPAVLVVIRVMPR